MLERAKRFALQGNPVTAVPYGNGHINRTFLITSDTGMRYMLQAVNGHVFPDTDGLMRNISLVTDHLRSHGAEHVLTVVPTADGRLYDRDEEGCAWRVFEYIENSVCLERAETEKDFYQSAVAFGRFQRLLRDFPASSLTETIPHFHDTPKRFSDFRAAVERDRCGRAEGVRKEIASALERESKAASLTGPLGNGTLPLRVTHNDTTLNNVLLDARTGEPLCVIDLDTVMPGAAAYDFGDSIRFGASTAPEDEKDLSKVTMDLGLYRTYVRGFLEACPGLTSLVIPEGVTEIGKRAFSKCTSLRELSLPDSLTIIRDSAFYNCDGLKELSLPQNLKIIDDNAFYGCTFLKYMYCFGPSPVLKNEAFAFCDALSNRLPVW